MDNFNASIYRLCKKNDGERSGEENIDGDGRYALVYIGGHNVCKTSCKYLYTKKTTLNQKHAGLSKARDLPTVGGDGRA